MGTLGRAIYTVGFWIRETSQAIDRLGSSRCECERHGYDDAEAVKNVLSYLPVLEGLRIGGSLDDYDVESLDINISAPSLKTLAICLEFDDFDEEFKICIDAPKLESLDVHLLTSLLNFSLLIKENLIVKANVDLSYTEMPNSDIADVEDILFYAEEPDRAIALLRNVSNVKYLSLSAHSLEDCTICNVEDFRHEFIPPEVVPISLSTQLKIITVNRFKGTHGEMELVKYLLKNGGVLIKMTIDASGNTNLPHARTKVLSKEVSLLQRGSKICQVEIRFGISQWHHFQAHFNSLEGTLFQRHYWIVHTVVPQEITFFGRCLKDLQTIEVISAD